MKSKIITLVLSLPVIMLAQINWTQHVIDTDLNGARSAYAVDLDSDSDINILAVGLNVDRIAWYENDGHQNFTRHIITNTWDGARALFTADFDNDNDIDIVGVTSYAGEVAWWENDGNENFIYHPIIVNLDHAISVYAVDMDGDTDIDVLAAGTDADIVTWFESDLVGVEEETSSSPTVKDIALHITNPLNSKSSITYQLSISGHVELTVYDITGHLVNKLVNGRYGPGKHRVTWDVNNASAGVYFICLRIRSHILTKKCVIIK